MIMDGIEGIVTYFNLLLMMNNDNKGERGFGVVGNIGPLFMPMVMKLIRQILDDKNIYIIT